MTTKEETTAVLELAAKRLALGVPLRIAEAALLLNMPKKTVEHWRYMQSLGRPAPALEFRRYGGAVRVTAASVERVKSGEDRSPQTVGDFVGTGDLVAFPGATGGER